MGAVFVAVVGLLFVLPEDVAVWHDDPVAEAGLQAAVFAQLAAQARQVSPANVGGPRTIGRHPHVAQGLAQDTVPSVVAQAEVPARVVEVPNDANKATVKRPPDGVDAGDLHPAADRRLVPEGTKTAKASASVTPAALTGRPTALRAGGVAVHAIPAVGGAVRAGVGLAATRPAQVRHQDDQAEVAAEKGLGTVATPILGLPGTDEVVVGPATATVDTLVLEVDRRDAVRATKVLGLAERPARPAVVASDAAPERKATEVVAEAPAIGATGLAT